MIIAKVKKQDPDGMDILDCGKKLLYSAREFTRTCGEWVKETTHKENNVGSLVQSSGLNFRDDGSSRLKTGAILYFINMANDVQNNGQKVGLFSLPYSHKGTSSPTAYPDNFKRIITLFAARKIIVQNWINNCDEYCAPIPKVEASEEFKSFTADSTILAMFHPANNCTAVRDIPFKDARVDIQNNMFWLAPQAVKDIACNHGCHCVYADVRNPKNTPGAYVSSLAPEMVPLLSPEANKLYDLVHGLFVDSMDRREAYSNMHPELHLNAWNAGWYQLKTMWKELYKDRFEGINEARRALERKLVPEVYELGFLRTYEGMGMQTHEAQKLYEDSVDGSPFIPKDIKTEGFDDCSICGGSGCAFCHGTGSREEFLYNTIIGKG